MEFNLSRQTIYRHKKRRAISVAVQNYIESPINLTNLDNQIFAREAIISSHTSLEHNDNNNQQIDNHEEDRYSVASKESNEFQFIDEDDTVRIDEQNIENISLSLLSLFYSGNFTQKG